MSKTNKVILAVTAVFLVVLLVVIAMEERAMVKVQPAYTAPLATAEPVPEGALLVCADRFVDLNSASEAELKTLPGIGDVLAARIVAYRAEHGPFRSPEELLAVEGVGQSVVDGLYVRPQA